MSTTERVRFTIAVDQEVYDAFAGLAHASRVSLSRCIGDWLRDTAEAAQITTVRVNEVRMSHQEIARLYFDSVDKEAVRLLDGGLKTWGKASLSPHPPGSPHHTAERPPRPVIRGGKSSEQGQASKGSRGSKP